MPDRRAEQLRVDATYAAVAVEKTRMMGGRRLLGGKTLSSLPDKYSRDAARYAFKKVLYATRYASYAAMVAAWQSGHGVQDARFFGIPIGLILARPAAFLALRPDFRRSAKKRAYR
ncbi:MAG: hypothetical protein M0R76_12470, partial [Proteobacteria bacterium]|nr:hypothetical protein [Pseudomonadota bacterium]